LTPIEVGSSTRFLVVWIWIQSKCYGSATLVSGVIDTADHKKIDLIVEYLREYEAICKKALIRGSRAQMELFDEERKWIYGGTVYCFHDTETVKAWFTFFSKVTL
jgi:hypothetical protein